MLGAASGTRTRRRPCFAVAAGSLGGLRLLNLRQASGLLLDHVLHLAAHGRHSAENPLFSGVELVDGPWYGYDIEQVAPVPDVVLLSACEVGRSQVRHGAELLGMTAAWQHAGVRSVVAAVAAVNDAVAHDVLVGVHRGLRAGLDPAEALRSATVSLPADGPPCPLVAFS